MTEFVQVGAICAELSSGLFFVVPDLPAPASEELFELVEHCRIGVGLILKRHSDRRMQVVGLQPDLSADLIELIRKSGVIPGHMQELLDRVQESGVDQKLDDAVSVRNGFHDCVLLLALPLKDCMAVPGGPAEVRS